MARYLCRAEVSVKIGISLDAESLTSGFQCV